MIELFRAEIDATADRIEDALRDHVLAYRTVHCTQAEVDARLGIHRTLPVLRDDDRIASGDEEVRALLDACARDAERWRLFQTDACYLDDDGNLC